RVVEYGSKKPIANIPVICYTGTSQWEWARSAPSSHSVTDAEGKFVLAPVPSGEMSVIVKAAEPYTEAVKTVQVTSDKNADAGDIEIAKGGTISGIVVRGTPPEPVANYTVKVTNWQTNSRTNKTVSTDAEGRFEVTGLAA